MGLGVGVYGAWLYISGFIVAWVSDFGHRVSNLDLIFMFHFLFMFRLVLHFMFQGFVFHVSDFILHVSGFLLHVLSFGWRGANQLRHGLVEDLICKHLYSINLVSIKITSRLL